MKVGTYDVVQVFIEVALAAEPRDQVAGIHALQLIGLLVLGAGLPHLTHLAVSVDNSSRLLIIIKEVLPLSNR